MEEKQVTQEVTNLVQKLGTYNYKLVIPAEVEKKIRFACKKVWNTEWSGTLFFTYGGSFENNDLVVRCVDIYIMDIGTQAYTEFDMNPDVIAYMCNNPELLDCQMGLIHSHNNMSTFFSGTDTATLKEEGGDRNNFVSLIVNNEGTYTAAITRRIKSKQVKESVSYEFFGEGERSDSKDYVSNSNEIEWFYLKIEKEGESYSFPEMDARLEEIRQQKKDKAEKARALAIEGYKNHREIDVASSKYVKIGPANSIKGNYKNPFDDVEESKFPLLPFKEPDTIINYDQVSVNSKILASLIRQLVTCSIIIPNESKLDIDKWVKGMPTLYEKRFGKGDTGMKKFKDWADSYTEFLTWNIEDKELASMGFDQTEIQSICAHNLIEVLTTLPENNYIKAYIDELEKYLIL